jgi:hypothetical protein
VQEATNVDVYISFGASGDIKNAVNKICDT